MTVRGSVRLGTFKPNDHDAILDLIKTCLLSYCLVIENKGEKKSFENVSPYTYHVDSYK